MSNSASTVAIISVAIALISIVLLFVVYFNVGSEFTNINETLSENSQETEARMDDLRETMLETSSNITLMQKNMDALEERLKFIESRDRALLGTFSPVAEWRFDDAANVGLDSSGNRNSMGLFNGLTSSVSNLICKNGGCLAFDGNDDYAFVKRSSEIEPSRSITISAWIYSTNADTVSLIDKPYVSHSSPFYSYNLQLQRHENVPPGKMELLWCLNTNGNLDCIGENQNQVLVDLSSWQLVTLVYDGSTMREYVNGNLRASIPKSGTIPYYDSPLVLGRFANGLPGSFEGFMDDVRIYDRALNESEILALYKNLVA